MRIGICIVDEVHTPDSSRYWIAERCGVSIPERQSDTCISYEKRVAAGQAPESIDKDILRTWYREHCDPYKVRLESHCLRSTHKRCTGRHSAGGSC